MFFFGDHIHTYIHTHMCTYTYICVYMWKEKALCSVDQIINVFSDLSLLNFITNDLQKQGFPDC